MKQFDTFTDPVFFTEVETELHPMPVPTIQQVSNMKLMEVWLHLFH
jgi:hypothetical protein